MGLIAKIADLFSLDMPECSSCGSAITKEMGEECPDCRVFLECKVTACGNERNGNSNLCRSHQEEYPVIYEDLLSE